MSASPPSDIPLHIWSGRVGGIEPVLKAVAKDVQSHLPGFFYTPRDAVFMRVSPDGSAFDHAGQQITLDDAFEVRVYSSALDARLRRDGDVWRVAIISETWIPPADLGLADVNAKTPACLRRDTQYLLWGRVVERGKPDGWTTLATARVGKLHVPFTTDEKFNGLAITAIEYFREAEDGNVVFASERLTGFCGMMREREEKVEAADA